MLKFLPCLPFWEISQFLSKISTTSSLKFKLPGHIKDIYARNILSHQKLLQKLVPIESIDLQVEVLLLGEFGRGFCSKETTRHHIIYSCILGNSVDLKTNIQAVKTHSKCLWNEQSVWVTLFARAR